MHGVDRDPAQGALWATGSCRRSCGSSSARQADRARSRTAGPHRSADERPRRIPARVPVGLGTLVTAHRLWGRPLAPPGQQNAPLHESTSLTWQAYSSGDHTTGSGRLVTEPAVPTSSSAIASAPSDGSEPGCPPRRRRSRTRRTDPRTNDPWRVIGTQIGRRNLRHPTSEAAGQVGGATATRTGGSSSGRSSRGGIRPVTNPERYRPLHRAAMPGRRRAHRGPTRSQQPRASMSILSPESTASACSRSPV